jgi:hypothetical protein
VLYCGAVPFNPQLAAVIALSAQYRLSHEVLTEALANLRGSDRRPRLHRAKGQRITVEHVNVHAGGQADAAAVTSGG